MFKQHLEGKICASCGRYFQWRKRWARNWASVRYCSRRCAGQRSKAADKPISQSVFDPSIGK